MGEVCLVSGPPGCGKTAWALQTFQQHDGPCAYLRFEGPSVLGLEQGYNGGIDSTWLQDQVPQLHAPQKSWNAQAETPAPASDLLTLIEVQQFQTPEHPTIEGCGSEIRAQLQALHLEPDQFLHFGRDPELATQDTLEFSRLESWHLDLDGSVWDPDSLNSFWFELVNGAYGDVYRSKALMNLPDGRSFFCNWMVSQQSSQFLPLNNVEPPTGRPKRPSELVVQGRALNPKGIKFTINDCLLDDDGLAMRQLQLRDQGSLHTQQD